MFFAFHHRLIGFFCQVVFGIYVTEFSLSRQRNDYKYVSLWIYYIHTLRLQDVSPRRLLIKYDASGQPQPTSSMFNIQQ